MSKSAIEEALAFQLRTAGVPFEREVRFHPPRKWRLDFVIDGTLAVEVEGGVYTNGRHTRGKGFTDDCEKYAEAVISGLTVMRVTGAQVNSGEALGWILRATGRE